MLRCRTHYRKLNQTFTFEQGKLVTEIPLGNELVRYVRAREKASGQ